MATIDQSRVNTVRTDNPDDVVKKTPATAAKRTSKKASKKTASKKTASKAPAQAKSGLTAEVGKIVHYYRGTSSPPGPDPSPDPDGQPLAAIIAHIVSDVNAEPKPGEEPATENRVNVGVFSADGGRYARQNILLFNGVAPDEGEAFVEWPEDKAQREAAQKAILDDKARVAHDQAQLRAKQAKDADDADLSRRLERALKRA